MTSRPKYNQYLTSNRRQVPAGFGCSPEKSNRQVLVLSRKGNQKQTRVLVGSQEKKVEYILCVHGHVLIHALKHTDSSFSKIPNAKLCDIFLILINF